MRLTRKIYFIVIVILVSDFCLSQNWVWKHITDSVATKGYFGTKGIGTAITRPGTRNIGVTWTDSLGNFWLFGGTGYASTSTSGELGDMWKYDPTTDVWTWMSGPNVRNQYGGYGIKGVASALNFPGTRHGSIVWKDKNDNFWLFGGVGYAQTGPVGGMNDLWKYNPYTNQWTWVNGPQFVGQPPFYGTIGVPSPSNIPGPRSDGTGWVDPVTGDLWMFGGNALGTSGGGPINDLWRYNIASDRWTWMKGPTVTFQNGTFGTIGVSSPSNNPGSRYWCNSFVDANGNFWLFGGAGYASVPGSLGVLNDLWKYDLSSNNWTWMHGSNLVNPAGNFGTKGVSSPSNTPARKTRATCWTDTLNNFWVYAGYDQNNAAWGDLWKYDPSINEWVWEYGSSSLGPPRVYGTLNVPSPSNDPGGRASAMSWTGKNGGLWLFGGTIGPPGVLNDLWEYTSPVISTGISENTQEEMLVYPNPGSDQIAISSAKIKINRCEVIDLSGKIVFEKDVYDFNTTITIQNLRCGLYTLKIISSSGTQTRKLSIINN